VSAAVENGTLDPSRLESFHKLQRELMHLESKHDVRARIEAKRAAKKLSTAVRRWHKKEE
jgi:ribosome biogenesis GTPase